MADAALGMEILVGPDELKLQKKKAQAKQFAQKKSKEDPNPEATAEAEKEKNEAALKPADGAAGSEAKPIEATKLPKVYTPWPPVKQTTPLPAKAKGGLQDMNGHDITTAPEKAAPAF